jgi:hypothetical protein
MFTTVADALWSSHGLAGVQWVLRDLQPAAIMRDALNALLIDGFEISNLEMHRAKFKPNRRLTTHYTVQVRDKIAGTQFTRLVCATLIGPEGTHKRATMDDLVTVQMEAIQRRLADPFRELMATDPNVGWWLLVSPLDAAFPQLPRLSDPFYVRDLLATEETIRPTAASYRINAIRYRPNERHVLRYQPFDAGGQVDIAGSLYAKIYNSNKGERSFKTASRVSDWLAEQGSAIAAVRPRTYVADECLVLYPHVSGTPLSDLLRYQGTVAASHLQAAGSALRALHRTPETLVELKTHSTEKEIKSIASASEHVAALLPATGATIAAMLEQARELHARLPQEAPAFAYGDFKADHLWVTATGMTLIDFDTCYLFDPAIDLGKFLADVHFWYDSYGLEGVPEAQEQFLTGYGSLSSERLLRARFYEALVLVKSTVRRVKLFEPDWAERTERLVQRAEHIFATLNAA